MNKIVFFGAVFAALATLSSCSNDEELTQVVEPVVKGTPFKVVLGNTTRADLTKTTTANLSSFQLYGIQQTATKNFWMDNVQFTKSGDEWGSTDNPTWPVTNKETTTNFYGFADGVTAGTPAGLTPAITSDSQSFTFTFGEGEEHTRCYSQYTQTQIDEQTVAGIKTAWQNQRNRQFTTVTTLDANADRLTDLLVTYDNTTGTEGTDGTLGLTFKHALSNLVVKAMFVGDKDATYWPTGTVFYIEWIRIYNLYTSGTYTFGNSTPWSFGDGESKVVYEKFFGEADGAAVDPRWQMTVVPYTTYNTADAAGKKATYQTIVSAGEFMMIPQDYSARAYAGHNTAISTAQSSGQCYIELCGYFKTPTEGATGRGSLHYFPLNVNNNAFLAGKQHVVVLDLTEMLNEDGSYLATPSAAGGSGSTGN